jgi:hypothetical protein
LRARRDLLDERSQLVADFDRILELDLNPLIVGPAQIGNTVADVRIRLDGT